MTSFLSQDYKSLQLIPQTYFDNENSLSDQKESPIRSYVIPL